MSVDKFGRHLAAKRIQTTTHITGGDNNLDIDGQYTFKNKRLKHVHTPLESEDAVNKVYVDTLQDRTLQLTEYEQFDAKYSRIVQVGTPIAYNDAVNKKYVDELFQRIIDAGDFEFGGKKLTRVGDPQKKTDAATKSYVDKTFDRLLDEITSHRVRQTVRQQFEEFIPKKL